MALEPRSEFFANASTIGYIFISQYCQLVYLPHLTTHIRSCVFRFRNHALLLISGVDMTGVTAADEGFTEKWGAWACP